METVAVDRELVGSYAREGSEAAFRALVARHINLVFAAAFRQVGDSGMAEEITQNVFVALARKAPRLVGHETLAGWLHRTAILEAKARIRSELRRRRREETAASLATVHPSDPVASDPDLTPLLDEALLNLREADRIALVLRFLEERSLREVGAALGIEEEAARKRVSRALERVTEFFRVRGFAVPATGGAVVLSQAAAHAAPAGLAATSAGAGLAAGGAATGLNFILLQLMTFGKIQSAMVGALILAVPIAWQERAVGALQRTEVRLASEESALMARLAEAESERVRLAAGLDQTRAVVEDVATRVAALDSRVASRPSAQPYRWSDDVSVARIPKEMLRKLPLSAVKNPRGELHPVIRSVLQLTDREADDVQSAVSRFLDSYHDALARVIKPVEPTAEDRRAPSSDVRVFEVSGLENTVSELRGGLFSELRSILDGERFEIFTRSLDGWMPISDESNGVSSGQAVFASDHRIRIFPVANSDPSNPMLGWGVSDPGQFSINSGRSIQDIPPYVVPYVQDWIDAAHRPPVPPAEPPPGSLLPLE